MTASPQRVAPRVKPTDQPLSPIDSSPARPHTRPRLLVSVRSASEAHCALSGGAEILDIKEPQLGSLGMASLAAIAEIARMDSLANGVVPLSVALGELTDWDRSKSVPSLPAGITYAKLGLSGCSHQSAWHVEWARIRNEFQHQSNSKLKWVAVAYADANQAAAPSIDQILGAAIETGCAGLLIDTWTKGTRTLLDFVDAKTVGATADTCHRAGLFLALAGRISSEALPLVSRIPADIIAIRSAACRNSERTSQVDSPRVTGFLNNIKSAFGSDT